MKATTTIPIVMTNSADPVGPGSSPVRRDRAAMSPGPPWTDTSREILGKRFELLSSV
jgi:hypothetical protein